MTAILLYADQDKVIVMSDGVAYDRDGVVRQIRSKQIIRPDLDMVAAFSSSGSGQALMEHMLWRADPHSFDEAHVMMPELLRATLYKQQELYSPDEYTLGVYGGFSEERGRCLGFVISTRDQGGSLEVFVPQKVVLYINLQITRKAREMYELAPESTPDSINADLAKFGSWDYALRCMLAARRSPYRLHGEGSPEGYGVGGFIQATTLMRGAATTSIVLRFPDEVGRVIDPDLDPPYAIEPVGCP